jgi:hypothetical protein
MGLKTVKSADLELEHSKEELPELVNATSLKEEANAHCVKKRSMENLDEYVNPDAVMDEIDREI